MADQEEALYKGRIKRRLEEYHVFALCINDSYTRGISDLTLCVRGRYAAVELKVGTPVTELQKLHLAGVRRADGIAGVLRYRKPDHIWVPVFKDMTLGAAITYNSLDYWIQEVLFERAVSESAPAGAHRSR